MPFPVAFEPRRATVCQSREGQTPRKNVNMATKIKIKKKVKFAARKGAGRKSPFASWIKEELAPNIAQILDKEWGISVPESFLVDASGNQRDKIKFSRSFTVTVRKQLGEEITDAMHVQCRVDTDGDVVIVARSYSDEEEEGDEEVEEESEDDEEAEDD